MTDPMEQPESQSQPEVQPELQTAAQPDSLAPPPAPPSEEFTAAVAKAREMVAQIRRVIIGQDEVIDQVVVALLSGGHVLLEGLPGLGKTLLVLALARTFAGQSSRVQFTPDLMPSDVTGHVMYDMSSGTFNLRKGPAFTNLLLADEINRAPAKTQAALLEVMQEQQITLEGEAMPLDRPFMTLATQNPIEQEGTYPLPEAQLDRFLLKIKIGYPGEAEEIALVRQVTGGKVGERLDVSQVQQVMPVEDLLLIQSMVSQVLVDDRIHDYAVRLVRHTRSWQGIVLGAGPRGAIALIRVARAHALLAGRDYVLPDDIKQMVLPVLRHRVTLAPDLEIEGVSADRVLSSLVEQVEAPRT